MAWQNPVTWTPGSTPGATEFNTHIRDMFNAVLPVGSLIYRVANATAIETVVENRFLECNGVAVSRATYAVLFAYLNALTPALPFGVGNGSTTFNLPDLRGRVPVAPTGTGGHADTLNPGGTEGEAIAKRTPKHYHQFQTRDGSATTPLDAPAYLVAGVWFVKYTA
jgi:microcystin-dependent protein